MISNETDIRIYPQHPRLGVGVVIFKDELVLLIKRGKEPNKGIWTVPGGLVQIGESVEQAAHREILEECNITINLAGLIDYFEFVEKDDEQKIKYHYVVLDFAAEYVSGNLLALTDAEDAKWVNPDQLENWEITEKTLMLINKALLSKARMN